jgi:hypothetical protein
MLDKTGLSGSGIGRACWFCATHNGVACQNVIFKQCLETTPYETLYGLKNVVSKFRPFGCKAFKQLNKDKKEREEHLPKVVEAITIALQPIATPEGTEKKTISNLVGFNEHLYPNQNRDSRHSFASPK